MAEDQDLEPEGAEDFDPADDQEAITPDVAVVREHLIVHLGAPYEVTQLRSNPVPGSPIELLEIAYFAPGGMQSPVLFATCGLSQSLMENGGRIEAVFMARPAPSNPAPYYDLLGAFALYPDQHDVAIGIGDVLPGGEQLSKVCPMDALLVIPPVQFVQGFHQLQRWDQQFVSFVWLVPVFENEAEYALKHGPEALLMLFAAQGLDLTDLKRDEANTKMSPDDAAKMAQEREEEELKKPRPAGPMAPSAPMPKRRPNAPGSKSFDAVEEDGETVVVRRRPKKAPPDASTVVDRPAAQASQPPKASNKLASAGGDEPKRFKVPEKNKPKRPSPIIKKAKPSGKSDPEAKKKKVDALRADAKARAARSKARKKGGKDS